MKQPNCSNSGQGEAVSDTVVWDNVKRDLKAHYGDDLYKSWLSKIGFGEKQIDGTLILLAPSNFVRDWIKSNYLEIISRLWVHHDADIKYVEMSEGKKIQIPEGIDSPEFSNEYGLPPLGENAPRDLTGRRLPVRSPNLVLPIVTGSHITEGTKTATVWFDKVDDSQALDQTIWN